MDRPEGLSARGGALWDAISATRPFNAAEMVVVVELCRMADRLDSLNDVLSGDVDCWARLETRYSGRDREISVTVDEALGEARQIAVSFQRLAASLNLPAAVPDVKDGIGDLAARRAARLNAG